MVTRRPVPQSTDKSDLPYPVTPTATGALPALSVTNSRSESPHLAIAELDGQDTWESESLGRDGLPAPLESGGTRRSMEGSSSGAEDLPESLRVGRPGYIPRISSEMQRSMVQAKNPCLQIQQLSHVSDEKDGSASAFDGFAERAPMPSYAPPPPPVPKDTPPDEKFAQLSLAEESTNPWQLSLDAKPLPQCPEVPSIEREDSANEVWSSVLPAPSKPVQGPAQPPILISMPSEDSPAWDEDEPHSEENLTPSSDLEVVQPNHEGDNGWQDRFGETREGYARSELASVVRGQHFQGASSWEAGLQPQESGTIDNGPSLPSSHSAGAQAPELPPRPSQEYTTTRPLMGTEESTSSTTGTGAATRRPKKETYEIKKVAWYDATASSNPRISPILVQNANGPCPLLALVNALTLSTPADANTALVDTLRSREQVSLGLLLDAVFDELMSGRRGGAAQELPDVGDLYAFLITLHTGMNVNPRFFPPAPTDSVGDPRRSLSHVHLVDREEVLPGTFEDTREMKLYSTFSIPLIHGWLPPKNSSASAALSRSAKTYEDAQNLMFREEELEDKLRREGLSFEEQSTLEDISTIKAFFSESATQLTPYGLDIITKSMTPGSVAILFRNDHFSTLYRHPESYQLLHLVTDMGYAGHDEVVWESLVDVNGENCEFFSGDFRIVGNAPAEARRSISDSEGETLPRRDNQNQNSSQARNLLNEQFSQQFNDGFDPAPMSPNTEQEDHDLALALQLQDEEEQRHQEELARRRREAELSQQYIEQQASQQVANQVSITTRGGRAGRSQGRNRGSSRGASELRPAIPPRRSNTNPPAPVSDPEAGVDVPPPSYEHAATQPSYIPPIDHPAHPSASAEGSNRRTSAYMSNSSAYVNSQPSQPRITRGGRVNSAGPRSGALINDAQNLPRRDSSIAHQQQHDREKDCIVM